MMCGFKLRQRLLSRTGLRRRRPSCDDVLVLKEVRCPACRRLTPWERNPHRPFCSERCRVHDLGNWASERYRIPGRPADAAQPDATEGDEEPS
jgi:endogenous inhibitor of DNA gyrase (YacG/DUF329 family)